MTEIVGQFPTLVVENTKDKLVLKMASQFEPKEVLRGTAGHTVVSSGKYVKKKTDDTLLLTWKDGNLRIVHNVFADKCRRYDVFWTSTGPSKLVDTFDLSNASWFGGAQIRRMQWPVNKWKFKMAPFVAEDSYKDHEFGGVQERYWLSSNGIGIFVHQAVPLFVGINESGDNTLRLQTKFDSPYRNNTHAPLTLRYSIYHGPDMKSTHQLVLDQKIDRPLGVPDLTLFKLPIWSTWAICKEDVDQNKVLSLAEQIKSYGIYTAQLEIDDDWTAHKGDWEFSRKKFPNPREMTRRLAELGYRVTVWVHPFANLKSKNIKKTELFVKGMARGAVKWWNGIGRALDVTNPTTVDWYKKELSLLKENYGLTSFKFDGGETSWLPKKWSLHRECNNPNIYTQKWAELAYELDKDWRSQEVRVGVRSQKLPMFVRMMDKDSVWSEKNGLQSIIPTALLYGVIGYPFFIPDVIGGNAYDERPSKQLFIRWVQVCTLMPAMQFSIPPWWFDKQTVKITKSMLALRAKHVDLIIKLAKEAQETGAPIIRPLWWCAPNDEFALKCDDQFLLGDDILVAPVLVEDAKKRPIYLPEGQWKDERSGRILAGTSWYFEYKVSIEDLPMFTRQTTKKSDAEAKEEEVAVETSVPVEGATELQAPETDDLMKFDAETPPETPLPETEQQSPEVVPEEVHNLIDSVVPESPAAESLKILVPQPSLPESPKPPPEHTVPATPELEAFVESLLRDNEIPEDDFADPVDPVVPRADTILRKDPADPVEEAETGGNLLKLLRRSMSQDPGESPPSTDLEDAFASLVRGKYRFSKLDEEFDEDVFFAELDADKMSLADYPNEPAPLARAETLTEATLQSSSSSSSSSDEDDDHAKTPKPLETDVKTPTAVDAEVTTPTPVDADLDSIVPGTETTEPSDLDLTVPSTDTKAERESGLYENVSIPAEKPASSRPDLKRPNRRAPPEPVPGGRLTLWEELTTKLADRPKFDPELDGEVPGLKTMAVQTSFDLGARGPEDDK